MAKPTRLAVQSPEVDVVSRIEIQRLPNAGFSIQLQPSIPVMNGSEPVMNSFGKPDHRPASHPPFSILVDSATAAGFSRMVALEAGALSRIVTAVLLAMEETPSEAVVGTITQAILQSGGGIDAALVQEAEALLGQMYDHWDALVADPEVDNATLGVHVLTQEFGVRVGIGPSTEGPFQVPESE